jgi:Cof subfamily protein (haloacid dehalogenase superfamily)
MRVPRQSLYVSDLDGTLLNARAQLSETTRQRLTRLLDAGIEFTVASARGVASMQSILRDLPLQLPVIGFNGAFLSDLATGQHEVVNAMAPEVADALHAMISNHGIPPLIATFSGREDRVYYAEPVNGGMQYWLDDRLANRDPRLRSLVDARRALGEQVVCLTGIGPETLMTEIAARIGEVFVDEIELHVFENGYSPGWHWLTVHDRRASKDQAVRELMRTRGLGDRELVAFGDQSNDLKLLEAADAGVAVANAIPELKARAQHVIGSNEEDSVVEFIERRAAGCVVAAGDGSAGVGATLECAPRASAERVPTRSSTVVEESAE